MARDMFHEAARNALIKDGWTITHDPFRFEDKENKIAYEADLGAEKLLAAEKGTDKIVVEVKSFLKLSLANEFHGIFIHDAKSLAAPIAHLNKQLLYLLAEETLIGQKNHFHHFLHFARYHVGG